ncbi:MAG: cyclic nucleotide-binding protein [Chloroflexi bacterium]|nr:cyclic nucleotide-binding protein [Chloroflexota bacterium]
MSIGMPLDLSCALIQIQNVSKIFKTQAGDFTALKDINLCFGQGEYVSIIGKSGSGKSTLINMITGIDHPTIGEVRVAEHDVHHMNESQLAEWRGRNLGIVFQFFQLLPMLSILENTILPMDFCNQYPPAERESRARALLDLVGLGVEAEKLPAALSGGQQQLAAIARALANDPPLIVADEPTGNLDSRSAARILDLFDELVVQGKTIIIVTHDSSLAKRTARRVLISDGMLIDENIAHALPMLSHPQMLRLSHLAVARSFQPGATLAKHDNGKVGLFVVAQGHVEAVRHYRSGESELVERLGPGAYFSELELEQDERSTLSFRSAAEESVEALWVSHEAFYHFLGESHAAESALRQAAGERFGHVHRPAQPRKSFWWRR